VQKELGDIGPIAYTPEGTSFRQKKIKKVLTSPPNWVGLRDFKPLEETLEHSMGGLQCG